MRSRSRDQEGRVRGRIFAKKNDQTRKTKQDVVVGIHWVGTGLRAPGGIRPLNAQKGAAGGLNAATEVDLRGGHVVLAENVAWEPMSSADAFEREELGSKGKNARKRSKGGGC